MTEKDQTFQHHMLKDFLYGGSSMRMGIKIIINVLFTVLTSIQCVYGADETHVAFDFGTIKAQGTQQTSYYTGVLRCPQLPTRPDDKSSNLEEIQIAHIEWAKEYRLITTEKEEAAFDALKIAFLFCSSCFNTQTQLYDPEKTRLMTGFVGGMFVLDDKVDQMQLASSGELKNNLDALLKLLKGETNVTLSPEWEHLRDSTHNLHEEHDRSLFRIHYDFNFIKISTKYYCKAGLAILLSPNQKTLRSSTDLGGFIMLITMFYTTIVAAETHPRTTTDRCLELGYGCIQCMPLIVTSFVGIKLYKHRVALMAFAKQPALIPVCVVYMKYVAPGVLPPNPSPDQLIVVTVMETIKRRQQDLYKMMQFSIEHMQKGINHMYGAAYSPQTFMRLT